MPNRLANETSPYLLQHADNPVDWYPWGDEALDRAVDEDKPVFLSIGYSACHWCHVMEHESFEDAAIAGFLNENFISIKVDREERPDLDHIYMQSVMAVRGGQGGWPLSAFLTPKREVFFGGTYWPPRTKMQMPGFDSVLKQVLQAFREKREEIEDQAAHVTQWLISSFAESAAGEELQDANTAGGSLRPITKDLLKSAAQHLANSFDFANGGFGSAPKFPHPMDLQLLLRIAAWQADGAEPTRDQLLKMVELNLDKMACGGIHDHLGGGFARYSVDEKWLVPHFEKMLYDNAQLVRVYSEAFAATGNVRFLRFAEKTIEYLRRDMLDEAGGFHSSEDADSEGVEGKFYVWTPDEIIRLLGEAKGKRFCRLYDVTPSGNFEGESILNLPVDIASFASENKIDESELQTEIRESRSVLLSARNQRIRPSKDDKVLTSWNALAIDGLSAFESIRAEHDDLGPVSSQVLQPILEKCVQFAVDVTDSSQRLLHSYRLGQKKINAFLDDYAYLINALLTYATFDWQRSTDHLENARRLAEAMQEQFEDVENGGFFFTPADQADVVTRYKDHHDGSVPSGNAMAAFALIRLGRLTGQTKWIEQAERTIRWALPTVERNPIACGQMLLAIDLLLADPVEIVVLLPEPKQDALASESIENQKNLVRMIQQQWLPQASVLFVTEKQIQHEIFDKTVGKGKELLDGKPTVYICRKYQCEQPLNDLDAIRDKITVI